VVRWVKLYSLLFYTARGGFGGGGRMPALMGSPSAARGALVRRSLHSDCGFDAELRSFFVKDPASNRYAKQRFTTVPYSICQYCLKMSACP